MKYGLSPHLRYCLFASASVFLDVDHERYFLLQDRADARFRRFLEQSADAADFHWLIARNIITEGCDDPTSHCCKVPAPTSGLGNQPPLSADIILTIRAIAAQITARRMLRRRPFADILKPGWSMAQCVAQDHEHQVSRVTAAFQRARHFVPAKDQCLVRSIAMRQVLASQGCHADLVIGVALPFSAHAWVQSGNNILTDPLELVEPYKPILVV
ncbi:lasso peptide biosynthesis B2 protein [Blastomonas sp. RAC04]|uniref:lasso peptide biosynthesis B2 protein n=1 Tax=Blastomonas sp. RAC04 TaxID=1842535 RepID=UPI00083CC25E|nr:lasso peptide biosynthesis B2 protein [Blastomonas sp. RAC04]